MLPGRGIAGSPCPLVSLLACRIDARPPGCSTADKTAPAHNGAASSCYRRYQDSATRTGRDRCPLPPPRPHAPAPAYVRAPARLHAHAPMRPRTRAPERTQRPGAPTPTRPPLHALLRPPMPAHARPGARTRLRTPRARRRTRNAHVHAPVRGYTRRVWSEVPPRKSATLLSPGGLSLNVTPQCSLVVIA